MTQQNSGAPRNSRISITLLPVIVLLICAIFEWQGHLNNLNNRLLDLRSNAVEIPPSGDIALVTIDPKSLQEIGSWPWSRQVHADLLNALVAANARTIFFDVAFAFPSDSAGDAAFSHALEAAGGGTLLASFFQFDAAGNEVFSTPYAPFDQHAWTVSVNIKPTDLGQIRTYPFDGLIEGETMPSAAAILGGRNTPEQQSFELNYAIAPTQFPVFSLVDVLNGQVDPSSLAGRDIIVGATAIELGDHFAVPVHQILPGAYIHAIASETLLQDIAIERFHPVNMYGAVLILMSALLAIGRRRPWRMVSLVFLSSVGTEAAAFSVFATSFVFVPTGFVHPALIMLCLGRLAMVVSLSDLLVRRKEVDVQNTQTLLNQMFNSSSDGFIIIDDTGHVAAISDAAKAMLELDDDATQGIPEKIRNYAHQALSDQQSTEIRGKIIEVNLTSADADRTVEVLISTSNVMEIDPKSQKLTAKQLALVAMRDVTETKAQQRQIEYLSQHDEQTGALRRRAFLQAIDAKRAVVPCLAICLIRIDRLKLINQTLGREASDQLLNEVHSRLKQRDTDIAEVARVDGNIFAFLTEQAKSEQMVIDLCEDVSALISAPFSLKCANAQVRSKLSYILPDSSALVSAEGLLQMAEDALGSVSELSDEIVVSYDHNAAKARARRRALEQEMAPALNRGEFYLVYQAQHRLPDQALIGVEALLRWNSPKFGQVPPNEFIPIAESSGFIIPLGQFVLEEAAMAALSYPDHVKMSPNVSVQQLTHGDFAADLDAILKKAGLAPDQLCLELTESEQLSPGSHAAQVMSDVARRGVTWALDDFGTGYASLSYLRQLPFSKVKLDQVFVHDIENDESIQNFVAAILQLCQGFQLDLLVEGVETSAQLDAIIDIGCHSVQGFFFGKPSKEPHAVAHPFEHKTAVG